MFKTILSLILLSVLINSDNFKYKRTEISKNITTVVPEALLRVSEQEILRYYPSYKKPIAAFQDLSKKIDFVVNISDFPIIDGDYQFLRKFSRAKIFSLYPHIEILTDEITDINKRKFVVFEFLGSQRQGSHLKTYHHIQYTILKNERALSFSFACPQLLIQKWNPARKEIMKNLKIKDPQPEPEVK